MSRLRDESGFTLPEVLTSAVIGVIVLSAVLGLLDTTTKLSAKTAARVESTVRGRALMNLMTRQVRSQVCEGTGRPAMIEATPTQMTFYASLAPASDRLVLQRRQLTYDPDARTVSETVWTGTGERPNVTFTGAPRTRVLAEGIVPVDGIPFFRYYRFQVPAAGGTAVPTQIDSAALPPADLARTVQVEFAYAAVGERDTSAEFQNRVYVRTSSPTNPDNSPLCL